MSPVGPTAPTLFASLALVVLIGIADYFTGYEVRLAILYLIPIAWGTWKIGAGAGAAAAAAAIACWFAAFATSHPYSTPLYFYLEGAATGATFLVIVLLLEFLRRALARSDARLISVLEGMDAAVQATDARTGQVLHDNRRFRELFGDRRFTQESGELHDPQTGRWFELRTHALRWTDGRPAVLRMLADVTEEREARELLARQREQAHQTARLVALGEFASAIAHELNQPLTATANYNNACLRLLESGEFEVVELQEAMRKCRDQALRAGAIIQRLRAVLRQPSATPAALDLHEVAQAVCHLAQGEAGEAGVSIELEPSGGLPAVRADRLLIEQVALNLVRNAVEAVQHLPPARRRIAIATTREPGGKVMLAVSDQGEGVPPEIRGRLFEAFVTTKARGLGLGLSICRSVIESLGGSIEYREREEGGARFCFSLPAEGA
jgi:C4-dicarboxylate-specific signal transduction histidine kinase